MKRENNEALSEMPPPKRGSPASFDAPVWRMRSSDQVFESGELNPNRLIALAAGSLTRGRRPGTVDMMSPSTVQAPRQTCIAYKESPRRLPSHSMAFRLENTR
jgi:hypothetical protein